MELIDMIVIFLIGFVGSFLSGMLGIGGSVIKYPMLLYIPPLVGMVAYSAHEVSGISAVQVLFASLAGVWAYRKDGYLNKSLILYMGGSILMGSLIGGYSSVFFSESIVNGIYALLATTAAIMMFIPKKEVELTSKLQFNKLLAVLLALIIGIFSGIVGAGGGFLLVPVMLIILNIPTRVTIATSLAITFISSLGSSFGKIISDQVLWEPTIIMVVASVIAAPIGAYFGKKLNVKVLKLILGFLIAVTALKVVVDLI